MSCVIWLAFAVAALLIAGLILWPVVEIIRTANENLNTFYDWEGRKRERRRR